MLRRNNFLFVIVLLFVCRTPDATESLPNAVIINQVEFVKIPAGWFTYSFEVNPFKAYPDGKPDVRDIKVWLDDYYLAKYEARASDLVRYLNTGDDVDEIITRQVTIGLDENEIRQGYRPDCTLLKDGQGRFYRPNEDRDLPATFVTWELADRFARWMGFRLPTEVEWQKGARGPDDVRTWPWGDQYPDDTYGHFGSSSSCYPVAVTSYPKGQSPYGLFNMAGNVAEYVADWYNKQHDASLTDGVQNPSLATRGSAVPYEQPKKISKGGRWSRDVSGHTIATRRLMGLQSATSREGLRFALDAELVSMHLAHGTGQPLPESSNTK